MRIINLVDSIEKVNFGIYNAAVATAQSLHDRYGISSEIWAPAQTAPYPTPSFGGATPFLLNKLDDTHFLTVVKEQQLDPKRDIIVSHGTWQWPTRWGYALHKMGFKWVYVPHGMLEPWSMQQKRLKKLIYYSLYEGRLAKKSDAVRAVGGPEAHNLKKHFKNVTLIPNGTDNVNIDINSKPGNVRNFLFMARLHFKKGIMPLVEAWAESWLANKPEFNLWIAGPDDGEKKNLEAFLKAKGLTNAKYLGAVYGEAKQDLLSNSHFYALPSHSEGFPTSVVEAMLNGAIPIISQGCNFPEAFAAGLVIEATPEKESIKKALEEAGKFDLAQMKALGTANRNFILESYTTDKIADQQLALYKKLGMKA